MVRRKNLDIRSRIATCLLLDKMAENDELSQRIGVRDSSHYTDPAAKDRNKERDQARQTS